MSTSKHHVERYAEAPLAALRPDPGNPRGDVGDITELAASMRSAGLLQPIIARRSSPNQTSGFLIVAGHRRLAAAKHLGWATVPVIVRRYMPPDEVLAAQLIENGQRAGLDPIEEARALSQLKKVDRITDEAIARRIGRSQAFVSGRLALLALPAVEQEALRAKETTLQASVKRARIASGTTRDPGDGARGWHLSPGHDLEVAVRARCKRLTHPPGRRLGGIGCGECWESCIRADERQHLRDQAAHGQCMTCRHQPARAA